MKQAILKKTFERQSLSKESDVWNEKPNDEPRNFYQIHFKNCQIGNNNTFVDTSKDTGAGPRAAAGSLKGEDGSATARSRNHTGILILQTIFSKGDNKPILLHDLELSVEEYNRAQGLHKFQEETGWALKDFLIKNKDCFETYSKKQKKFVKLRSKKKRESKKRDLAEKKDEIQLPQSIHGCLNDNPLHHDVVTDICVDAELDRTNSDEESWTEVKPRKKKRGQTKTSVKNEIFDISDTTRGKPENKPKKTYAAAVCRSSDRRRSWSPKRFEDLIKNGEDRDLLFVRSPGVYQQDPLLFSIDVASMWNTPHRGKSYIVIGISRSSEVVGVDEDFDISIFDNLFHKKYFTQTPVYTSYDIVYKSKRVCIIEVISSCGHDSPCVVQKGADGKNGLSVVERQVWVRAGNQSTVCNVNDVTDVYQWFLRPMSESRAYQKGGRNVEEKQSVRHTGTNTNSLSESYDLSSSDEDPLYSSGDSFTFFWDAVKGFRKGHFVLLAGNLSCKRKYLDALAKVPWICVYDFDIFSCSDGLLNALQDALETERHLTISTWKDAAENISERGTRWCFMRGRREFSDSRTDLKNDEEEDVNVWFKLVKRGLMSNCEKLANFAEDYTVPTVVFMWPENEKLVPFMVKFLFSLNDTLTSTPNIVLCMNRHPETKSGRLKYENLCEDFSHSISVCNLEYEQMCIGIRNHSAVRTQNGVSHELPKNERFESPPVTEKDATWLKEDFEVLFLKNPYETASIPKEEVQEEVSNFCKGGTLPWTAWYRNEAEQSVIDRDIQKDLEEKINKHLDDYKTSVITLCHAPGSGGTTLAQKTLWHFHMKIPCVYLKLRTASQVDELDRKISFLHDRTDLPVLLLIDGEEECKVRRLSRRLKYTVILYVKRYPYKIPYNIAHDRVYLSGIVSTKESQELESKLGKKCADEYKRKRLQELTKDIQSNRSRHCMYEYGMTVYLHEFKGIVSYVDGYLELDKNPTRDLTLIQKCLGYLALVYYYGQTCVPCQFFSALFNKPPNFNMTLDDFPSPIQEFVVYDKNEAKRNNIRICHYIVAKEILEQILSRHINKTIERSDTLGILPCRNLSKFCIDFIEYASSKKTKVSALSTTIRFILTKTFIFRDEKDMGDNEEQVRKKPVLSKLMIDIPGGKPLFTERLKVLKKLTESFPDDPNYCAHLGRFHAFCRPDEDNEAEKCFQRAVKICEDQIKGKRDDDIDEGMKLTMMHIYHMYGIVKQRYVSKFTGRSHKEKVVAFDENFIFHERLEELVPIAETACEYFTKSRDITPDNHDVYTYAYTGEIQLRLQICDFVNRHFSKESVHNRIREFLHSEADQRAKLFVQRSISVIENLILECYMDVDLMESDVKTLRHYVVWYNGLFKTQVLPLIEFSSEDDVSTRRLKIAAKKLKYGRSSNLSGVETIDDEKEVEEIVKLYEANFSDIQDFGFQDGDGKKELERDYRDWIYAIRHEKFKENYSLEEVLSHVQNWNEKVRSPISTFYLFILKSLLGFGTGTIPGKTECLIEALECREQLIKMNHLVIRPKYPREWLGNDGVGIKRLKSGSRHVGICGEDRDLGSSRIDLAVCKGTICRPNSNKVSGMIALDLGVNTTEVRVYFIPKVVKLEGNRFAEQRVEFNLAFSVQHGFEAYNVKLLKRHGCSHCSRKIEFTSIEQVITCKCGRHVYKDEINEIK